MRDEQMVFDLILEIICRFGCLFYSFQITNWIFAKIDFAKSHDVFVLQNQSNFNCLKAIN